MLQRHYNYLQVGSIVPLKQVELCILFLLIFHNIQNYFSILQGFGDSNLFKKLAFLEKPRSATENLEGKRVLISYLNAKGNYGFGRVNKDENLESCSDEKPNVFVFNKNFYLGLLLTSIKPNEKNLKIKSKI